MDIKNEMKFSFIFQFKNFTIQLLKRNNLSLFSYLFLLSVACPTWGQVTSNKKLNTEDYYRWSTLTNLQISDDGNWISYYKHYDYGQDTLFVESTLKEVQFYYPNGGKLKFFDDGKKAIIKKGSLLWIQDLNSGNVEHLTSVLGYHLFHHDKYLIIRIGNGANSPNNLIVKEFNKKRDFILKRVKNFVVSPNGNTLLYTTVDQGNHSLFLLDLLANRPSESRLLGKASFPFRQLVWSSSGNSFAFLQSKDTEGTKLSLHFYKKQPKTKWFQFIPNEFKFHEDSLKLSNNRIFISRDDLKVFFKAVTNASNTEVLRQSKDELVEIWYSSDKIIYPRRKALSLIFPEEYTWVWWPEFNRSLQLGTPQLPNVVITKNYKHSISFNKWDNEPQFKRHADLDLYITDLDTGKKELFLEELSYQGKYFSMSEHGDFIKYFKQGDWWVYNIQKNEHINLTTGMRTEWYYFAWGNEKDVAAYGSPGWSKDGNSVLIYDRYDLWEISLDGKSKERMTQGAEKKITFRISEWANFEPQESLFPSFTDRTFDLAEGLVLEAKGDNLSSGYFYWKSKKGVNKLVYGPKNIYNIRKAKNTEDYIYLEESFEDPTRLVHLKEGLNPKTLANPNFFQKQYAWGQSSLIDYRNKNGEELKGVLIYPANYIPGNRYPMVVHIYDEQRRRLYEAMVPTELIKTMDLNTSVLAAEGYFVLLPDIKYTHGKPGSSALDCVVSAVNKVIDMGVVDRNRIGLYGASFGGFETTYIISQTNLFATAIAGVALTDLVKGYLSINENDGHNEALHFEHHQYRMGSSFKDNFKNFVDNSPVYHAATINTPLLGWVGKEDRHVHWTQSVELYLALRRLNKDHILLVYPKEAHSILDEEKQKDLRKRISEWFAHYLKDEPKKQWMNNIE